MTYQNVPTASNTFLIGILTPLPPYTTAEPLTMGLYVFGALLPTTLPTIKTLPQIIAPVEVK